MRVAQVADSISRQTVKAVISGTMVGINRVLLFFASRKLSFYFMAMIANYDYLVIVRFLSDLLHFGAN